MRIIQGKRREKNIHDRKKMERVDLEEESSRTFERTFSVFSCSSMNVKRQEDLSRTTRVK